MVKQISLRLPDDLHGQLKASAEHDVRSLHAEIIWRLRRTYEQDAERDAEKGAGRRLAG